MDIRVEERYNNSLSILRGPLYFSLRIDKEYKSVKINYDNFGYKGSVDWEIYPISAWNYGLMIDRNRLSRGLEVTENQLSEYPFADKGDMIWSADSAKYITWDKDAAVVITTRGMKIPGWTLKNNSADIPPLSPVKPEGTAEVIQLVPYGSAKLRITEFPVIDLNRSLRFSVKNLSGSLLNKSILNRRVQMIDAKYAELNLCVRALRFIATS